MTLHLNRRHFLLGSAALGLARPALAAEKADVVIIGAGLSGLNAALTLAEQGTKVIVLEADKRPGGRVRTLDDAPLKPDAGGSEVGPLYARTSSLCGDLKVGVGARPPSPPGMAIHLNGRLIDPKAWPAAPENTLPAAWRGLPPFALEAKLMEAAPKLDSYEAWLDDKAAFGTMPYGKMLEALGATREALHYIEASGQLDGLNDVSALWALRRDFIRRQSAGQGKVEFVKGGMSRLTDAMAAKLGDAVWLNARVTRIDHRPGGVGVSLADGRRISAGKAIITVPLPVLSAIAIDPMPDAVKRAAWAAVPYGRATSVFLPVKGKFWEEDGLPPSTWGDDLIARYFLISNDQGSYIWAYASGAPGDVMRKVPMEECASLALKELARIRPSTAGRLEPGGVFCWARHPFAKATFASRRPGHLGKLQQALKAPIGPLHFAGEHTADLAAGLEGALETGERAAVDILSA